MPTTAPESLSHKSRLPPSVLIGWLLAVSACAPLESARLLQLANSPAGLLAWFSAWSLDTSLPLLVLATLPPLLFLFRDPARQVPRTPSPPPLNPQTPSQQVPGTFSVPGTLSVPGTETAAHSGSNPNSVSARGASFSGAPFSDVLEKGRPPADHVARNLRRPLRSPVPGTVVDKLVEPNSGSVSLWGASNSGALVWGARKGGQPRLKEFWKVLLIGCLAFAVNASIGLRTIEIPPTVFDSEFPRSAAFHSLPPAYHDEFSYLLQAQTFLAGRVSWPAMTVGGDAFHQIHVLNRPVTASRYFPWTGLWIAPFLWAGTPILGHWLAGALAAAIFYMVLRRLIVPGSALAGGILLSICPGLAVFSNLLLAHHPTLLALAIFLWCFQNLQLTGCSRWSWLAGIALTCAMLGRPMTAAGFAAPFGIWLVAGWFRIRSLAERFSALRTAAGFALPLAAGFLLLTLFNGQITGQWNKSPYQLYTDTWTPRHRFGFENAVQPSRPENVLARYDAWAENLTPRLALRNLGYRVLASSQWTLGIAALSALLPAACFGLFRRPRDPADQFLRLIACSILSQHAFHLPYWYDGILHWHYVFETAPLLLLLSAAGLERWFSALQPRLGRRAARGWLVALTASALLPSWFDAESFWGPSRVTLAVSEQAYSRVRMEAFERIKQQLSRQHPCLILVDEQNSDQQLSYIINPPNFEAPALVARLPANSDSLSEIQRHFPNRSLWRFNPQTFEVQQLRGWQK